MGLLPCRAAADWNLQDTVAQFLRDNAAAPAAAVVVVRDGRVVDSAAAGFADPKTGRPMTPDTPLRIASVTKTYVAATLLAVSARRDISLDTSIEQFLPQPYLAPLREAGYDTAAITLAHLLTHRAGLRQHTHSLWYRLRSFALRWLQWRPLDTVQVMAGLGPPLAAPGALYRYSDTGYVLLGQVLEHITGKPLHLAVRETLGLDALALDTTWWERFEAPPAGTPARAQQYFHGWPANGFDASVDLYGGGGLIASAKDMALFYDALFGGRVFADTALLRRMKSADNLPDPAGYRYGVLETESPLGNYYSHSGSCGTEAMYFPQTRTAIAGVVTLNTARGELARLLLQSAQNYR